MNDSIEIEAILNNAKSNCYVNSSIVSQKTCELIFDGMMCWPPTPAGVLANQSCSNQYIKSTTNGSVTKQCDDNGAWLIPSGFTHPWTNYSECGKFFIKKHVFNATVNHTVYTKWIPVIKNITQFGYIVSTLSLIIALFIFIHIKRLHCARNKLHIQLFVSFVMRALMSLIKDGLFVKGTALRHDTVYIDDQPYFTKENYSWICKAITSLRNYFIITNYTFLLMEGAYLHNLLFLKLLPEDGVAVYYYLGWGLPLVFIIPWIILRLDTANEYCWTQKSHKYISLLIDIPIGLTVVINFILFIIIMRVLFVKLNSMYLQQTRKKYSKLLRATLILVPLFGIPYAISVALSFYATKNETVEILWLFWDQTFASFHGLFASLVYCFLNSEVQTELLKKYKSFKDGNKELKRRTRTISHTQQIPLNEVNEIPQTTRQENV